VGDTLKIDGWSLRVTQLTECSLLLNELFAILFDLVLEHFKLIDTTVAILDVALKEGAFDEICLLTVLFLGQDFDALVDFADEFHPNAPLDRELKNDGSVSCAEFISTII